MWQIQHDSGAGDPIDNSVGLECIVRNRDHVGRSYPLVSVYTVVGGFQKFELLLERAVGISATIPPETRQLIVSRIT